MQMPGSVSSYQLSVNCYQFPEIFNYSVKLIFQMTDF